MSEPAYPVPDHEDLRRVVDEVAAAFEALPDDAWDVPAAGLDWSCRETAAHLAECLAAYAMQISGTRPLTAAYLPLVEVPGRPEGPGLVLSPPPDADSATIAQAVDTLGGLLAAVVQVAPPDRVGWHPAGAADASGFAAMGIVEAALHAYDVLATHDRPFRADDRAVHRTLNRVFPHAVRAGDPWADLLVAGGRTPETREKHWRWYSAVRDSYEPDPTLAT